MIDTAEKLANALRDFSPTINDDDVNVVFNAYLSGYKIGNIEEKKNGWAYEYAIKFIKKEYRHQYKVIYIHLDYKSDFIKIKGTIYKKSNIRKIEKIDESAYSRLGYNSYYYYICVTWFNGAGVVKDTIVFYGVDSVEKVKKSRDEEYDRICGLLNV